jgi:FkbM family methyltransferase
MRYVNLVRHVANWPLYFAFKWGLRRPSEIEFRLRPSGVIRVPTRRLVEFKQSFFDEVYVRGLARPVHGGDVIDIGANVGCFTLFAASALGCDRVIAFEPDPGNFRKLEENALLNPDRKIFAVRKAVGRDSGDAVFFSDVKASFPLGGTLVSDRGKQRGYKTIHVQCTSLADIFSEYGISRCPLLKLDCEGAEFDILETADPALLKRIDQIAMEVHDMPGRTKKGLVERLNSGGFDSRIEGPIVWAWQREAS